MIYVHFAGLMVKLHNMTVAILMGGICAVHTMNADGLGAFRTMFRALFMPFMYNALLIINNNISDPFGGDIDDFPLGALVRQIRDEAKSIWSCGSADNLPLWIQNHMSLVAAERPLVGILSRTNTI